MGIKYVETIYSPGTAVYKEDGIIQRAPFYGVLDGLSAPYSPSHPPILFDGQTDGEVVVNFIRSQFYNPLLVSVGIKEILINANQQIAEFHAVLDLNDAGQLSGAGLAIAEIGENEISIMQAGDCFIAAEYQYGMIMTMENRAYVHDKETNKLFSQILARYNGDKGAAWDEFVGPLAEMRRQDINVQYAMLNGQESFWNCVQQASWPLAELERIMFFTDGFGLPGLNLGDTKFVASLMLSCYNDGSLRGILDTVRCNEQTRSSNGHVIGGQTEATAMVVEFE